MKSQDRQKIEQQNERKKANAANNDRITKLEEKMDGFAETQAKILEILEQNGIDRKTEAEEKKEEKKAEKKAEKKEEKKAEKKAEKKEEKKAEKKALIPKKVYQVWDASSGCYKIVIDLWEAKQFYGDYTPVWAGFLPTGEYSHLLSKEEMAMLLPRVK